jgi:ComF family protein
LVRVRRVPVCDACLERPQRLVAEHQCVSCQTPFQNRFPLDADGRCALCRSGLRAFDAVYCFGPYEGTLRTLIHLFKYGRVEPLAKPLGEMLAGAVPSGQTFDVVVPMPLHWRRRWQRGFNQSELLARIVARRYRIPLTRAVRRIRATRPQAGLTSAKRRQNVSGVFGVRRAQAVAGLRVLLVDDVMTTGATGGACALALKRAGAQSVALLALGRADRRAVTTESSLNRTREESV